jgi:hypothetical protein
MSNAVATLNATLATQDWVVLRAALQVSEVGAPPSPIFNRGIGTLEIRWLMSDSWIEGTGIPVGPTTNGVVWNDIASLFNPTADVSLGQFTNSGTDSRLSFVLGLNSSFVTDIRAGGLVTLYLTAVSPQVGFTANSRSVLISTNVPELEIIAAANPHPKIEAIADLGTNVLLSFNTISNRTYVVQVADKPSGSWSNFVTFPAEATNSRAVLSDPKISSQRFYRLSVSE